MGSRNGIIYLSLIVRSTPYTNLSDGGLMIHLPVFFTACFVLAITPGPGLMYVLARATANGREDGLRSSVGTFLGGMFHVLAASLGLSALLVASAIAFSVV